MYSHNQFSDWFSGEIASMFMSEDSMKPAPGMNSDSDAESDDEPESGSEAESDDEPESGSDAEEEASAAQVD